MGRKAMLYFAAVVTILLVTFAFVYFASGEENAGNIEFLQNYGWKVDKNAIETEEFTIPEEFDRVYESYNELQKKAGLDLEPYKGKKAKRYTYTVKNYPRDTGGEVRANVVTVDGKCVAGDIMTVSLDGFMHSLLFEDAR